ncbi:Fungal_trans domain-containing protein [Trichoderma simmonsii]|uniref:Fungal_trans domain-containing protein n=1 Tax=Trichoderma simmonsii TaxID=1491479 RepID=A0A8G0LFW2_9HYPO|nr:Fungal_trans domain-containing protein [Trichoderma simmonsii]
MTSWPISQAPFTFNLLLVSTLAHQSGAVFCQSLAIVPLPVTTVSIMPPIRACDVCFKRKIECCRPGPSLPCNWCSHQKLACTVTREKRTTSVNRIKRVDANKLLDRIKHLEDALAQANALQHLHTSERSRGHGDSRLSSIVEDNFSETQSVENYSREQPFRYSAPAEQNSPSFEGGIHAHIVLIARLFGRNWYHRGMPIISENGLDWIASRTDQDTTTLKSYLPRGGSGQASWSFSALQIHDQIGEPWDLPDRDLIHKSFGSLSSPYFLILFPLLDKVLLKETISTAYQFFQGVHASHTNVAARACLWAAFAVLAHMRVSEQFSATFGSEMCATRAQWFLGLLNGPADLTTLQALMLLHKYRTAVGQYSSAEALYSTACRMVCELDGHLQCPTDHENSHLGRRQDHIRKLFWLCYISDKDLALLSGLPPILANEYCDLGVLHNEHLNHNAFLQPPNAPTDTDNIGTIAWNRAIPFLPGDPHLGLLKERIFRLLYSPSALKIIDSELLTRIRQLDDELESWRLSVPPTLRPKLSILPGHGVPPPPNFLTYLRSIQLQLEYHYLLTIIHTPVRRFGAAQGAETSPPEDLHSAMHSSIDLSLEASRSTFNLLNEPIVMLKQETFWHAIIYPLVAAMSLFVNILIHPVGAQAIADVKSLALASKVVDRQRTQTVTDYEAKHNEQAGNFVTELLKLANGAILKANGASALDRLPTE